MTDTLTSAVDFYEKHPISAKIILSKLEAARGTLDNLTPQELYPHDQDHYGGLEANDRLAAAAGLTAGEKAVDFCAGLGGPARYYALKYGIDVTGVDITPARVAGAAELTQRVGLQDRVRVIEGDVTAVPLGDALFDIVLSQEAFLHVPDIPKTFAEAYRLLKAGGRFAFTTWTVPQPLSEPDRQLMWDGMAVQKLYSRAQQEELLRVAGFTDIRSEDVSAWWRDILIERLAMYQKLRGEAEQAAAPAGHDAFYRSYILFVELIKNGGLGGVRFVAHKPAAYDRRYPDVKAGLTAALTLALELINAIILRLHLRRALSLRDDDRDCERFVTAAVASAAHRCRLATIGADGDANIAVGLA